MKSSSLKIAQQLSELDKKIGAELDTQSPLSPDSPDVLFTIKTEDHIPFSKIACEQSPLSETLIPSTVGGKTLGLDLEDELVLLNPRRPT